MELPSYDADQLVLLYVQQYLHESGADKALAALEQHTGTKFDDTKLVQGSQLLQLVWKQLEDVLAQEEDEAAAALRKEEEKLLRMGNGDFPSTLLRSIENRHPANIITVRMLTHSRQVVTGSGDGCVRCFEEDGPALWSSTVGSGAVLCLDVQPSGGDDGSSTAGHRIAAGSMDGSISVLESGSGALVATHRPHTKYVVRVQWYLDGQRVVSASHDQSLVVSRLSGDGSSLEVLHKVEFTTAVLDCALHHERDTLIVGVRESNYLRLYNADSLQESGKVNMNELGDDHVSFSARHISLSPCGSYLLVSTDSGRMIVMKEDGWHHMRALHGLPVDKFHQPCACWSRDSAYVFAAANMGQVHIYHVGSAKVVAKLSPHTGSNVRDLHYDVNSNQLMTCSFDKTVKVFGYQES